MDIEPLSALGGWFLFSICMATPKTQSTILISTTRDETQYENNYFLVFLIALVFIFVLLISTSSPTKPPISMASSSIPIKRLLLESSDSSASTTTMNLHPKQTHEKTNPSSLSTTKSTPAAEVGVEAHEVPSGPNPISNR